MKAVIGYACEMEWIPNAQEQQNAAAFCHNIVLVDVNALHAMVQDLSDEVKLAVIPAAIQGQAKALHLATPGYAKLSVLTGDQ